ncbi:MAG: ABC transporter ATP-binding protein [Candidatus Omnitrophota bacterium]
MNNVIETKNLKKVYKIGRVLVHALNGVDLNINSGEFISVMGPSGCGKSTFLHLLGALTRPTAGEIKITGTPLTGLSNHKLTLLRRKKIGFVFQTLNLLPTLSAIGNLELLFSIGNTPKNAFNPKDLLNIVGLGAKLYRRPSELSYGEQQRVAIARALLCRPEILLADEPTGNLDSENSLKVLDLLSGLNKELNQTVVLITHDKDVANAAKRIVHMKDGKILN